MTSSREKNLIIKDTDLLFHWALESCCILHFSSIQDSQYSLSNSNYLMYATYVPRMMVPFLRIGSNSFPSFFNFHSVPPRFWPPSLCSALSSSLKAHPSTSAQTHPLRGAHRPCDIGWWCLCSLFSWKKKKKYRAEALLYSSLQCSRCLAKWLSINISSINTCSISLII